jgi:hypothetical protein
VVHDDPLDERCGAGRVFDLEGSGGARFFDEAEQQIEDRFHRRFDRIRVYESELDRELGNRAMIMFAGVGPLGLSGRCALFEEPDRERAETCDRFRFPIDACPEILDLCLHRVFEQGEQQLILRREALVEAAHGLRRTGDQFLDGEVRGAALIDEPKAGLQELLHASLHTRTRSVESSVDGLFAPRSRSATFDYLWSRQRQSLGS